VGIGGRAYHRILYFQCPHQGMSFTAKYLAESPAKFFMVFRLQQKDFRLLTEKQMARKNFFCNSPFKLEVDPGIACKTTFNVFLHGLWSNQEFTVAAVSPLQTGPPFSSMVVSPARGGDSAIVPGWEMEDCLGDCLRCL
jgi:hypothetical protein